MRKRDELSLILSKLSNYVYEVPCIARDALFTNSDNKSRITFSEFFRIVQHC